MNPAEGADTCARVNALLKYSYVDLKVQVVGTWYRVRRVVPIGNGFLMVTTEELGEGCPLTVEWHSPFIFYMADNWQEYVRGERDTEPVRIADR